MRIFMFNYSRSPAQGARAALSVPQSPASAYLDPLCAQWRSPLLILLTGPKHQAVSSSLLASLDPQGVTRNMLLSSLEDPR